MFNAQEYANANPDLPASWTDEQFQSHYNVYGFDEGRDVYWSAMDYISLNTDLAGMTDAEAFSHWVSFGNDEGRVPWFQADAYRDANGDLAGLDDAQALSHWVEYGRAEDRIQGFDVAGYLELNDDVPQDWTYAEALNHFYQYGEDEGRAFDPYVDGTVVPPGTITATDMGNNVTLLDIDTQGGTLTLTADDLVVDGGVGTQVLRMVGDSSVRIDLTDPSDQVEGLDLDGNGLIAANGIENNLSNAGILTASNFEVFDAYARNPINETDHDANYFGDIGFDGTGFAGDGVTTDGNIYLGGLGVDTAFGGIGNDFMAGGGVAAGRFVWGTNDLGVAVLIDTVTGEPLNINNFDSLYGGRNADFFFIELSALDTTDGNLTQIDGGSTWDDDASQDSDWVLLEVSDDNEPATVNLGVNIILPDGTFSNIVDIEHLDASGDLYSFLDSFDAVLGGMRDYKDTHAADGTENSGLGSTGQMNVLGDGNTNIVIAGYDNDTVDGAAGDDILFGGKLGYLLDYANNPNLLNANNGLDLNVTSVGTVNDGRDTLNGGNGDDAIIFEMDGGNYEGGINPGVTGAPAITAFNDILFVTDFSMGRMQGHTSADELAQGSQSQADALAALTTDSTVRMDLGVGQGVFYRGYGGADTLNNEVNGQNFSADQTNYQTGVDQTTVQDIDGVIATGLGDLDYDADGENISDLSARYQANFAGINADMDLRGIDNADVAGNFGYFANATLDLTHNAGDDTLYANTGDDILEGRQGNDLLSGGRGHDDFIFNLNAGDDVDIVHRQVDDDVNGIWDDADGDDLGDLAQDYRVAGDGISADPSTVVFSVNNPDDIISVLFTLDGTPLSAAGAGITAATTMAEIALETNAQLSALDANLSAVEDAGDLVITDAAGRAFTSTSIAGDLGAADFVASAVIDNGTPSQSTDEIDRVIFKSYAARATNLGTDDQQATLGNNAYAQDLVVGFEEDGDGNVSTSLVNRQTYDIQFQNLSEGDVVTVTINGVDYARTVAVGETTDAFVLAFTNQINNETWDLSSTSGQLFAVQADVFGVGATAAQIAAESVLQINEVGGLVYMSEPTVTITNPNGTPGTVAVADISTTTVELMDYDGRNNDINEDTVLFVGNTGATDNYGRSDADPTDISDGSDYSWSVLATALTDGGTLTGADAILVDLLGNQDGVNDTALHGDDLLIGAAGDDVINAGTGDDTIVGSAGTDTVDGGGNEAVGIWANTTAFPAGVLQDAAGAANYTDILVFNEDNFGADTQFDIVLGGIGTTGAGTVTSTTNGTVSGETTYTGIELVRTYSNFTNDTLDFSALSDEIAAVTTAGTTQLQQDMLAAEGVDFDFDPAVGMDYDVDLDNDGVLTNAVDATDEVNIAGSAVVGIENIIGGGANDTVTIEESQIGSANTIDLAGNANSDTVGALNVGQDTVTYDHQNVPPNWAAGGFPTDMTPDVTVAVSAANTLVSFDDGVLGTTTSTDTLINVELLNITQAATSDRNQDVLDVSGMAGALVNYGAVRDMGDTMQPNGNAVDTTSAQVDDESELVTGGVSVAGNGQGAETLIVTGITNMEQVTGSTGDDRVLIADNMQDADSGTDEDIGFDSYLGDGTGALAVQVDATNNGLFQFNLGDGASDSLDYRNEADDVAVVLASDATTADRIIVDDTSDAALINIGDRVDLATGVERYFGGQGTNRIDLSETTMATTVEFSVESQANANEYVDPDGHLATADTNILGIEVRDTALATVFGRFMDAPANAQGFNVATAWSDVVGNAQAQTVIFSDNENVVVHTLDLEGGANVVNYTDLTSAVTFAANVTADNGGGLNPTLLSDYTATPAGGGADDLSIERADASGSGTLTVIGSGEDTDTVDIAFWGAVAPNSYNVVNLATGTITEDALETNAQNGNFDTTISGFENVTGSAVVDHITGDGQGNTINAGDGDDEIQGNGGADTLTGDLAPGAGADDFIYTTSLDGNIVDAVVLADADDITDFVTAQDFLVITGALQASLESDGTLVDIAANAGFNADGGFGIIMEDTGGPLNTVSGNTFAAGNIDLADVAGEIGPIANGVAGDEFLFIIDDTCGVASGLFYFQEDGTNLLTIDAADTLTLMAWTTGAVVAATDVVTRIESGLGSQIIDTTSGGLVEMIYDAQTDSTLGSRDELANWDATTAGAFDKIDLSAFALGNGVDLGDPLAPGFPNDIDDNLDVIITQTPVSVDGASNMPDFFLDTVNDFDGIAGIDNVDRAVVVQKEAGTAGYRVFVDVNGDGDFSSTDDMVIDITGEVLGAGTLVDAAFTTADFIFA